MFVKSVTYMHRLQLLFALALQLQEGGLVLCNDTTDTAILIPTQHLKDEQWFIVIPWTHGGLLL